MSLKDRLNKTARHNTQQEEQTEVQPEYYQTNEEEQFSSLGVIDIILGDDELNSIFVCGAKNIFIEKRGKFTKTTLKYRDNVQLENIIRKNANNLTSDDKPDDSFISFNHKIGVNVCATLPPLTNMPSLCVKCYKDKFASLQILQEELSISKEISLVLEAICNLGLNILITGERNTLKTSLLSALAKKIPPSERGVLIDYKNEFKIESGNFLCYDFSAIADKKPIINSVSYSNPDKIYINDCPKEDISVYGEIINSGCRGLNMTLCAQNPKTAIDKIASALAESNPCLNSKSALDTAYGLFDVVIFTKRDDSGRKVFSFSIIKEGSIVDIFSMNENHEHISLGVVPDFCADEKNSLLNISSAIFEENYRHTYHKNQKQESFLQTNAKTNMNIFKKLKQEALLKKESQQNIQEQNEIQQAAGLDTQEQKIETNQGNTQDENSPM